VATNTYGMDLMERCLKEASKFKLNYPRERDEALPS